MADAPGPVPFADAEFDAYATGRVGSSRYGIPHDDAAVDDLNILLAALMRRLGDEAELSQDEIEDARRRLRDEEWHFVAFRASFLAPDLVTVKMRSRPRKSAHAAWSDVRSARMDSPEAQAGYQAAADEHNPEEPTP